MVIKAGFFKAEDFFTLGSTSLEKFKEKNFRVLQASPNKTGRDIDIEEVGVFTLNRFRDYYAMNFNEDKDIVAQIVELH